MILRLKNTVLLIEAKFETITAWLCRFNTFSLFLIKTAIMIPMLALIQVFLLIPEPSFTMQYGVGTQLLIMVLITPYLETLFFHSYLLKLGLKYIGYKFITVILSAVLFGGLHAYSGGYIIAATISGLIYGTYYFTFLRKSQNPVLRIYIMHAANNLLTVILTALA